MSSPDPAPQPQPAPAPPPPPQPTSTPAPSDADRTRVLGDLGHPGAGSVTLGGGSGAGRAGGIVPLVMTELTTLYRRWRTWAMLAALALIPILIGIAIRIAGSSSPGRGPGFLDQIAGNGLFVGLTALVVATPLFLPLTISVVAGDTIAGEASLGTLRYLLIAPAGRLRLLLVKYAGAAAFCLAAALTVVAVGTLVGWVLFPIGPVRVLSGGQISVGEGLLQLVSITAPE